MRKRLRRKMKRQSKSRGGLEAENNRLNSNKEIANHGVF